MRRSVLVCWHRSKGGESKMSRKEMLVGDADMQQATDLMDFHQQVRKFGYSEGLKEGRKQGAIDKLKRIVEILHEDLDRRISYNKAEEYSMNRIKELEKGEKK